MKYLILLLLFFSNVSQAQMSCIGLFEVARLLSEEEINVHIEELINLKAQALREGGISRHLFNDRFGSLLRVISKSEITQRMRAATLIKPEIKNEKIDSQDTNISTKDILKNEILVSEFLNEYDYSIKQRGENPFHLAVYENRFDLVDPFLELGYDINVRDSHGKTPLFTALGIKIAEPAAMVSMLLERGADPYFVRDRANAMVPGTRKESFIEAALYEGTPDVLQVLVNAKFNMNIVGRDGKQPIHQLATYGFKNKFREKLDVLIQANVDINSKDSHGMTVLDYVKRWPVSTRYALTYRINEVDYLKHVLGAKESRYIRNRLDNIKNDNLKSYGILYYHTYKERIIDYGVKVKNSIEEKMKDRKKP